MSDDPKEKEAPAPTVEQKQEPEREPGNTVPFVPYDDSSMNPHIYARRRRLNAALDTNNQVFPPLRNVIVPPQQPPENPQPVLSPGLGPTDISLVHTVSVVPDWPAVRAEMIPRLDAIEAGLRELAPVIQRFEVAYREHARIGHNNPPEDIDVLPIDLAELELGIAAANLARTEINSEQPRSDVMRVCGLVLHRTGWLIAACVKWLGGKADKFVDALIPLTAAGLAAKFTLLNGDITEVVNKIRHVLELLHSSF